MVNPYISDDTYFRLVRNHVGVSDYLVEVYRQESTQGRKDMLLVGAKGIHVRDVTGVGLVERINDAIESVLNEETGRKEGKIKSAQPARPAP